MAQTDVRSFFPGANEGVTYALPDTKINIRVKVRCITQTPGEFYSYAERYLHIKDAISQASSQWELIGIETENEGIPCKEKAFTIKLNNSSASNLKLNDKGIIEAINTTVPEKVSGKEETTYQKSNSSTDVSKHMTEEMLKATSTAKMAELAAKEIFAARESKRAITRGVSENMPGDGAAMAIMIQELDTQETALLEMFKGKSDTLYYSYDYELVPDIECDITKAILFRFSRKLGVLDKENLAGEPVYYSMKNLRTVEQPTNDIVDKKKSAKKEGICYNIPGRAKLEIYTRARTYVEKEIAIAQLGITEVLSKTLFNKNNTTKVLFDTATGAIISIKRD